MMSLHLQANATNIYFLRVLSPSDAIFIRLRTLLKSFQNHWHQHAQIDSSRIEASTLSRMLVSWLLRHLMLGFTLYIHYSSFILCLLLQFAQRNPRVDCPHWGEGPGSGNIQQMRICVFVFGILFHDYYSMYYSSRIQPLTSSFFLIALTKPQYEHAINFDAMNVKKTLQLFAKRSVTLILCTHKVDDVASQVSWKHWFIIIVCL